MDKRKMIFMVIGIAVLGAGAMYRLAPVIKNIEPSQDKLFLKEMQVAKFKGIIKEKSDLELKLASLNRNLKRSEAGLLSGDTPALAAVDIQNILSRIAGQIGIDVQTMRVMEAEKDKKSNYLSIPVQFRISCTIAQLKQLLYKIETSQKYLRIESIRINVRGRGGKDSLFSYLTVVGFMKSRRV